VPNKLSGQVREESWPTRDAGDRSEENFERLRERNIDGFISPGREGKAPNRTQLPETKAMKRRLGTKRGRAT
jgi:hypothetical protein